MVPEAAFMVEGLQVIKRGIANDIVHFIPTATAVRFEEVYAKREAPKPAAATAPASEATPLPAESSAAEAPQPSA